MTFNVPIIRLELQGMRQEMLHAFGGYTEDLKANMEAALDRAINEFSVDRIAYEEASRLLRDVINVSIREAIADQVAKEITRRFKEAFHA